MAEIKLSNDVQDALSDFRAVLRKHILSSDSNVQGVCLAVAAVVGSVAGGGSEASDERLKRFAEAEVMDLIKFKEAANG